MKNFEYIEDDIDVDTTCISDTPSDILYFDIETTGLSANRSDLYLIGVGFCKENKFHTQFLFNDDGCSEPEMLTKFAEYISAYRYLVSYNGDTFDIPYIKTKMQQFDVYCSFDDICSVDIYKTTRKYKKLFNLDSVKQIDIEDLVGFKRNIFISGGNLINTYKEYLNLGSQNLLNDLMTHNHDDVRGLISITGFLNLPLIYTGLSTTYINVTDDSIDFICSIPPIPCRITYASPAMRINAVDSQFRISIPLTHGTMKFYFKDYKNYYYLPLEDMAIHKSMAAYVDSSHKEKATKETAYTSAEGSFLPAPSSEKNNLFYNDGYDGNKYIQFSDDLSVAGESSTQYIREMIKSVFPTA